MEQKRPCKGLCKKYRVKKLVGVGRYGSGQCRCQICDIWMDYRGCHLESGVPASVNNYGWICNCCNFKVRKNPRNKKSKEKLRETNSQKITTK